jgi:hypothetical protein
MNAKVRDSTAIRECPVRFIVLSLVSWEFLGSSACCPANVEWIGQQLCFQRPSRWPPQEELLRNLEDFQGVLVGTGAHILKCCRRLSGNLPQDPE